MRFTASAEVFQPAYPALNNVRKRVELFLNRAFSGSSLAAFEGKLRYVPIVMPIGMRERYPPRSGLKKRERVYDCAPQLNYDIFVEGSFDEQLAEYLRGIASSAPHLAGLGASLEQIEDFKAILASAANHIAVE